MNEPSTSDDLKRLEAEVTNLVNVLDRGFGILMERHQRDYAEVNAKLDALLAKLEGK
jgi:hypothetical protein